MLLPDVTPYFFSWTGHPSDSTLLQMNGICTCAYRYISPYTEIILAMLSSIWREPWEKKKKEISNKCVQAPRERTQGGGELTDANLDCVHGRVFKYRTFLKGSFFISVRILQGPRLDPRIPDQSWLGKNNNQASLDFTMIEPARPETSKWRWP